MKSAQNLDECYLASEYSYMGSSSTLVKGTLNAGLSVEKNPAEFVQSSELEHSFFSKPIIAL